MNVTILEIRPGTFRIRKDVRDADGKRKHEYETFKGDRFGAEKRALELRATSNDPVSANGKESLRNYFFSWVTTRERFGEIEASTRVNYANAMLHVLKMLGDKPVREICAEDLKYTYAHLLSFLPPSRVNAISKVLHRCLRDAVRDKRLYVDPTREVKTPSKKRKTKLITLTDTQMQELIDASRKWGMVGFVIRFALVTGMRRGEICALQWREVDLDAREIQVAYGVQTMSFHEYKRGPVKSPSSNRPLTIPVSLRDELLAIKGNAGPDDFVFSEKGKMLNPMKLTRDIGRKMVSVGLGHFSIHDLRHAHATHLLRTVKNWKAVSRRLGHSDVSITLGIYSHVMPGDDAALADQMNSML